MVLCHCCNLEFSLSAYEKHGGGASHKPWDNIYLLETDYPLSYYRQLEENNGRGYFGGYGIMSLGDTPEAQQKREKYEEKREARRKK
jgi:hypothetical protein